MLRETVRLSSLSLAAEIVSACSSWASRRRKLLDYVKAEDLAKYNDLLQKLSLRK